MDLSVIVPTYNEKDNISEIIDEIHKEFINNKIKGELIIVDDNSPDGTGLIADSLKKKYSFLRVIHRKGKEGLSSAVLEGFSIAEGKILGVMDADLSHPVNKIHEMHALIKKGQADLVIGSRYIPGGKIEGWTLNRKIMSKSATYLAKIFTKAKDPMSGFFMIKRSCLVDKNLNPRGFKILLEIIIKTDCKIYEIPITFINRKEGKSKASVREIRFYLQNLLSYLPYKRKSFIQLSKFAIVGMMGIIINIFFLYLFTEIAGIYYLISAVFAFLIALAHNYLLNKIFTFKERIRYKFFTKFLQFSAISLFSLAINLILLYILTEMFHIYYLISQVISIGLVFIINFAGNKFWTFR
ncbi:MAG: glycosyltransferase family 2 protein [Nanoarchaeota archaeon]|nr:glycosyltransferase family 2 protein [Nanoarchaeota archaeon]